VCDGKMYVWYVKEDDDHPCYALNIISQDKMLMLSYPINSKTPFIVSKGKVFQNHKSDGGWKRYLHPAAPVEIITPKFVSELIRWAIDGNDAVEVLWDGKDICM